MGPRWNGGLSPGDVDNVLLLAVPAPALRGLGRVGRFTTDVTHSGGLSFCA